MVAIPQLARLSAPAWALGARGRFYATVSTPQTLVEKIVQKYAVGLSEGVKVRAGDYVMIKPEHVYVYPFKSTVWRCAEGIPEV